MWINVNKYSPAKRHFHPDAQILSRTTKTQNDGKYLRIERIESVTTPAICTNTWVRSATRHVTLDSSTGKELSSWGGLSAKEKVNLNQRNLCSYCVKKYVYDLHPELIPAYEAFKKGVLSA